MLSRLRNNRRQFSARATTLPLATDQNTSQRAFVLLTGLQIPDPKLLNFDCKTTQLYHNNLTGHRALLFVVGGDRKTGALGNPHRRAIKQLTSNRTIETKRADGLVNKFADERRHGRLSEGVRFAKEIGHGRFQCNRYRQVG